MNNCNSLTDNSNANTELNNLVLLLKTFCPLQRSYRFHLLTFHLQHRQLQYKANSVLLVKSLLHSQAQVSIFSINNDQLDCKRLLPIAELLSLPQVQGWLLKHSPSNIFQSLHPIIMCSNFSLGGFQENAENGDHPIEKMREVVRQALRKTENDILPHLRLKEIHSLRHQ